MTPADDKPTRPKPTPEGSVKETLESIAIAFILAFAFRAFVVEAFVIPTGSMAPTLLGQHVAMTCPECGYRFDVGPRDTQGTNSDPVTIQGYMGRDGDPPPLEVDCPMCRYRIGKPEWRHTSSGDRILVHKFLYSLVEPKRWDVVVFKNPQDRTQNYIKRLVGLPGEELWIVRGDVYARPMRRRPDGEYAVDPEADWQIQRKYPEVQRAVWQPVYDSRYVPLDAEVVETDGVQTLRARRGRSHWIMPWQPFGTDAAQWRLSDRHNALTFNAANGRTGMLRFAFDAQSSVDYCAYNRAVLPKSANNGSANGKRRAPRRKANVIKDLRIAATVMPKKCGARLWLVTTNQEQVWRAVIEPDGQVHLQSCPIASAQPALEGDEDLDALPWATQASGQTDALPAGRGTRVELWHVDHALWLWVGDRQIICHTYDDQTPGRKLQMLAGGENHRGYGGAGQAQWRGPYVAIGVQADDTVTVNNLNLDRDLYYTQQADGRAYGIPRGVGDNPLGLGRDAFFCLGDNSPASMDSRFWVNVDREVKQSITDLRTSQGRDPVLDEGIVPREMMIGRAFFVYFPAPYRLQEQQTGIIPDFGNMRFID